MFEWMIDNESAGFGLSHLPLGVATDGVVVRIGGYALHLSRLWDVGVLEGIERATVACDSVVELLGSKHSGALVRSRVREWVDSVDSRDVGRFVTRVEECHLGMPFSVRDYVDFYSSRNHAENLGKILRPGTPPLAQNWEVVPIGYHGRAGTVVVSGTPVVRPSGVTLRDGAPSYRPTERLDIEAELGYVVVHPCEPGSPLSPGKLKDYVGGVVLVNDWSARDIQAFEYVPLGPFLGKSFATSISAWVTPMEALEPYLVEATADREDYLGYLRDATPFLPDLEIEIELNETVVSRSGTRYVDWSPGQQLSHITANGATVRAGDLFATGTLSGPQRDQVGSLIELTWNGQEPLTLANGDVRTFLEDGDRVTLRAKSRDGALTLGEVGGTVVARKLPLDNPRGAQD